jgi:hypothetical protein
MGVPSEDTRHEESLLRRGAKATKEIENNVPPYHLTASRVNELCGASDPMDQR